MYFINKNTSVRLEYFLVKWKLAVFFVALIAKKV